MASLRDAALAELDRPMNALGIERHFGHVASG
jgi:hypothetical protein